MSLFLVSGSSAVHGCRPNESQKADKVIPIIWNTLTDGLEWCGLLWCFYQLFGLLFWRHPFTAENPLASKWCNATFRFSENYSFGVNYYFKQMGPCCTVLSFFFLHHLNVVFFLNNNLPQVTFYLNSLHLYSCQLIPSKHLPLRLNFISDTVCGMWSPSLAIVKHSLVPEVRHKFYI